MDASYDRHRRCRASISWQDCNNPQAQSRPETNAAIKRKSVLPSIIGYIRYANIRVAVNTTHFSQGSQQYFIFDYSGNEKVRAIWRVFLSRKEALVFVIDSTNRDNMEETKEALWNVLRNIMLDGQPVLILANKQDHPVSMKK